MDFDRYRTDDYIEAIYGQLNPNTDLPNGYHGPLVMYSFLIDDMEYEFGPGISMKECLKAYDWLDQKRLDHEQDPGAAKPARSDEEAMVQLRRLCYHILLSKCSAIPMSPKISEILKKDFIALAESDDMIELQHVNTGNDGTGPQRPQGQRLVCGSPRTTQNAQGGEAEEATPKGWGEDREDAAQEAAESSGRS